LSEQPEVVGRELAESVVLDVSGAPLRVGDTWVGQPGLLVFVRQFGCVACALQTSELLPRLALLGSLGVRTLMIGTGPVDALDRFVERSGLRGRPITVATDPERAAYRAAGMIRSVWGTWGPPGWPGFVRGTLAGHANSIEGDPNQQGGAILVDEAGHVVFTRRSTSLGDVVAGNDLVEQSLRLAAARVER
jgi:hypothetical protein